MLDHLGGNLRLKQPKISGRCVMNVRGPFGSRAGALRLAWLVTVLAGLFAARATRAQSGLAPGGITFTKDIVPILQHSCQPCHRPNGVAPMSLVTYEEVRP